MSALNLAQSLIRIKSISPNDAGCFELIEPELACLGFKVEKIRELNSETLLAKFGTKGKIFCYLGHTDVVPSGPIEEWSSHPFEANVVNDELIGRGAADMKASIAAFIEALKNFLATCSKPNLYKITSIKPKRLAKIQPMIVYCQSLIRFRGYTFFLQ